MYFSWNFQTVLDWNIEPFYGSMCQTWSKRDRQYLIRLLRLHGGAVWLQAIWGLFLPIGIQFLNILIETYCWMLIISLVWPYATVNANIQTENNVHNKYASRLCMMINEYVQCNVSIVSTSCSDVLYMTILLWTYDVDVKECRVISW